MTNRKTKILITGGSGRCGMHLRSTFYADADKEVYALSRTNTDGLGNEIHHDLSLPLRSGENNMPENIDVIIHTASVVDEASHDFSIIEKNLSFAYHILEYAKNNSVKKIINLSSIAVYGDPHSESTFSESDPVKPRSNYGLSKYLIETMLNCSRRQKLEIINLRLGYVISQKLPFHSVIRKLANLLNENKEVTLIDSNYSFINLIDIRDITKICEILLYENSAPEINCVTHAITIGDIYSHLRELNPESKSITKNETNSTKAIRARYSNERLLAFRPATFFYDWKDSLGWALS